MGIAEQTHVDIAQRQVKNHDAMMFLGYSIIGIVLLTAIYLGSVSSGTALGDFTSMTVFP